MATVATARQLRPCCTPGCPYSTYTLYCASCLAQKRTDAPKECQHKFWYAGEEYIERMMGATIWSKARRPVMGEIVECCRDCGKMRYFVLYPHDGMGVGIKSAVASSKAGKTGFQQNRVGLSLTTPRYDNHLDIDGYNELESSGNAVIAELRGRIRERGKL